MCPPIEPFLALAKRDRARDQATLQHRTKLIQTLEDLKRSIQESQAKQEDPQS